MREQLVQYVNLLFAGSEDTEEIREEILQNTLDRYDDLIDQGKSPEAAYRLAITGIGDLNEIIYGNSVPNQEPVYQSIPVYETEETESSIMIRKLIRAVAIGLYILCPIPVILMSSFGLDEIGVCGTLGMVAAATILLIVFSKKNTPSFSHYRNPSGRKAMKKSINKLVDALGLALYFIVSFATGAWAITWLIFPLMGAVNGLVNACIDLREE